MKQIEFTARLADGRIDVPNHLRRHFDHPVDVKVTVLDDSAPADEQDMLQLLLENPLAFEGPFLTRDQAHERDR